MSVFRMSDVKEEDLVIDFETTCDFCGGQIQVYSNRMENDAGLLHTLPPCKPYLELDDPAEFLRALRMKRLSKLS